METQHRGVTFGDYIFDFATGKTSQTRESVGKYTNRITDSENFELLVIFSAKTPYFGSQSIQF